MLRYRAVCYVLHTTERGLNIWCRCMRDIYDVPFIPENILFRFIPYYIRLPPKYTNWLPRRCVLVPEGFFSFVCVLYDKSDAVDALKRSNRKWKRKIKWDFGRHRPFSGYFRNQFCRFGKYEQDQNVCFEMWLDLEQPFWTTFFFHFSLYASKVQGLFASNISFGGNTPTNISAWKALFWTRGRWICYTNKNKFWNKFSVLQIQNWWRMNKKSRVQFLEICLSTQATLKH